MEESAAMSACEHSRQVSAYYDGELPPEERARVEEHIRQCPICAKELDQLRQISRLLGAARIPDLPADLPPRLRGAAPSAADRWLVRTAEALTAVAAAVLVASGLWLWRTSATQATRNDPFSTWEETAVTLGMRPPSDEDREIRLAQWIVEDLSRNSAHE